MKKRVFILAILVLILATSILGAHTATVNLYDGSLSTYETNSKRQILQIINNFNSCDSAINKTEIITNGYVVTDAEVWGGWIPTINSNKVIWIGDKINCDNPSDLAYFKLTVKANEVNLDTNFNWEIKTTDEKNEQNTTNLTFTVLNDSISPSIFNINPISGIFVKNESINFIVNISEYETSISNSIIRWDFETAYGVSSTANFNQPLFKLPDGTYQATIDLSNPGEKYMFFEYVANDSVGNSNSTINYIAIDKEKPIVNLESPSGIITNGIVFALQYNATDNSFSFDPLLNPQLNCDLLVNGTQNSQQIISNTSTKTFNVNTIGLSDGLHNWQVSCEDKAGWITTSETRTFTLDTTGPAIILDPPLLNESIITNGTTVNISVNDQFSSINLVWYSLNGATNTTIISPYDISTTIWPEGLNTLIVYANDSLGNLAQNTFVFTIDATPPSLTIISPADYSFSNSNVTFLYNATDLSGISFCQLTLNSTAVQINTTSATSISTTLTEGSHAWSIRCVDNVGLSSIPSTSQVVIVDTTSPNPNIVDLYFLNLNNTNDADGTINIDYSITDPSGISSCNLFVGGTFNQTTTQPVQNFTLNLVASNNPYSIYITCNDTVNNLYTSPAIDVYYDNIAPIINGITSSIGSTSATINWNTDEFSNSRINYSTDQTSLNLSNIDINNVTQHTLQLTPLTASTAYYYQIFSADKWGNVGDSTGNFNTITSSSPGPTGSSGGGGGSNDETEGGSNITCSESDFECSDWGECQKGIGTIGSQSRTCNLKEGITCEGGYIPLSLRNCELPEETIETSEERSLLGTPLPTGAAIIEGLTSTPATAIMVSLLVLLIITAVYRWVNNRPPKRININNFNQEEIKIN